MEVQNITYTTAKVGGHICPKLQHTNLCPSTLNLDLEKSHIFLRVSIDPRRLLKWLFFQAVLPGIGFTLVHEMSESFLREGAFFTSMLQSFQISSQIQFMMCHREEFSRCKIQTIAFVRFDLKLLVLSHL